jgi:hypothetical protein
MTAIHIGILQCQYDSQLSILTRFKNYSSFHLDKPRIPVGTRHCYAPTEGVEIRESYPHSGKIFW